MCVSGCTGIEWGFQGMCYFSQLRAQYSISSSLLLTMIWVAMSLLDMYFLNVCETSLRFRLRLKGLLLLPFSVGEAQG